MYSIPCRTSQYSPGRRIGCIHPFLHISLVQFILLFVCIMLVHNSQRDKELINSVPQTSATTFAFSFVCFFFYAPDTQGICTVHIVGGVFTSSHVARCTHGPVKTSCKKITPPPLHPPCLLQIFYSQQVWACILCPGQLIGQDRLPSLHGAWGRHQFESILFENACEVSF